MSIEREQARDLLDDFLYYAQHAEGIMFRHSTILDPDVEPASEAAPVISYATQHQLIQRFLDQEISVK